LVLEQGSLEELFLGVFLVAEIMVMGAEMEGEEDKLMELIPSFLVRFSEEDQEAATVGGRKDKLQGKINQGQGSLGWTLFLVEGTITVVTVLHSPIMVDTTMDTIMVTTMGTTMDKIMVDTTVDTTAEVDTTSLNSKGVSATTA